MNSISKSLRFMTQGHISRLVILTIQRTMGLAMFACFEDRCCLECQDNSKYDVKNHLERCEPFLNLLVSDRVQFCKHDRDLRADS